jgi:hypothetical protein
MISCSPAYFRARPARCCALATRLHDSVAMCRGLVGPPGCRGRAPPDEWEIHRESGGHRPGLRPHGTERIPDPAGRGANGTAAARYIAGPGAGAGLLKPHGRQRIDSTHEFAAIRVLNRLERVGETLRHALNSLAVFAPDWLRPQVPLTWFDGYGARIGNDHLPNIDAAPQALAATIGADGRRLLQAVETATDVPWLRCWVRPILRRIGRISHPFVSVSARLWQTLRFGQCCVVPVHQTGPRPTLLGKSRRSIATAMEESFSRGMSSVSLAFKRCLCDRVSARF